MKEQRKQIRKLPTREHLTSADKESSTHPLQPYIYRAVFNPWRGWSKDGGLVEEPGGRRRLLMKDGNNNIGDKRLSLILQRLPLVASLETAPLLCRVAGDGWQVVHIPN